MDLEGLDVYEQRQRLNELLPTPALAASADGRTVAFIGPLTLGVHPGHFAVVELAAATLAVQVRSAQIAEREGPMLELEGLALAGPLVRAATLRPMMRQVQGEARVLGPLRAGAFTPVDSVDPFEEHRFRAATGEELASIVVGLRGRDAVLGIGELQQGEGLPAELRSKGFARHTFMCGQSGSGKTYTTGVIFERLLGQTDLPVVVLDPNSDHVHLGELRDPEDRSPAADRHRRLAGQVVVAGARGSDAPLTLRANISELSAETQALLLRLDPVADLDEFNAMQRLVRRLPAVYSVHDLASAAAGDDSTASIARRIENLGLDGWDIWCRPGEASLLDGGLRKVRCVVLDVGSLPRPAERSVVALALLRNRWAARAERHPTLLAVDEAHNVFPSATTDPLLLATTELGTLIAGEGRKFGLHLFLASQRPAKLAENVLSQCDNLVLMRMNGVVDVEDLCRTFSHVPAPLIRRSLAFRLGEALFAGPIAPTPIAAKVGTRLTPEGGGDVPTTWTTVADEAPG